MFTNSPNLIRSYNYYYYYYLLLLLLLFCSYAIALLDDGQEPVKYLGPDDKVMTVKGSQSTTAQLVLCIRTPEKSLLEVISSIKNNVSTKLIE